MDWVLCEIFIYPVLSNMAYVALLKLLLPFLGFRELQVHVIYKCTHLLNAMEVSERVDAHTEIWENHTKNKDVRRPGSLH
jgi:hypothetical protein